MLSGDDLGFVEAVDRLGERVVVRVAVTSDSAFDARFGEAFGVTEGDILNAAIAVMDEPVDVVASAERLFERVECEVGSQRWRHAPTDDGAREDIDDEGDVREAFPRRNIRDVGDPKLIRAVRTKLPLDEVRHAFGKFARLRRDDERLASSGAAQARVSHETFDGAACDFAAFFAELPPHLRGAINAVVTRCVNAPHLGQKLFVTQLPKRATARIKSSRRVFVVGRRGHLQHVANALDPVLASMLVDEVDFH